MGMTHEEAIKRLETCDECGDCLTCAEHDEALDMAIAALREQCVREATKTSGETVTNSHQFETVTNCHGLTNADHIRSMTDEELMRFLFNEVSCGSICEFCVPVPRKSTKCDGHCRNGILSWLKQPYGGDT